ncbi:nuclear transport factor 2 family protein [Staphylococcus caprae]|uniref:nuclear transport factor 2 family protein n=1 Tax=Staphylococcus caprae TaxID=29380 RepID=UPI000E6A8B20|nr:nuclear transport factor 2 family protein [Staphylococcus caprae]MBU5271789.1 nuclear transport factor 2 family protein [Staphylococcus caprae]MDK6296590.1 nuclear transport factor 2 family protein [Staphylococcus caprae]MDK7233796.1 nuclear transport factor 2 family protein [Staphylococcus caprae]RIM35712.1 nuclear transport factor 2 family protein [Staphylococcus caprae]
MNRESLKSTIEKLYNAILINLDVEKINMYFAPSYIQTTDHHTSDINEFTDHLKKLKEVVARLSINEFKTMLIDESQNTIFLRYDVNVEKKDGFKGKVEVYAEFVFNEEGKVISCNELTQSYSEELNGIGSVK